MTTYNIASVVPRLDHEGKIEALTFTVTADNGAGLTATRSFTVEAAWPAPASGTYTEAQLAEYAGILFERDSLHVTLDHDIVVQTTPVYVAPPPPPPLPDAEKRKLWMSQIDANVAAVYSQFTRFQMEYEMREKAALAYKEAGYTGEPTTWLTAFADNVGISYKACADLVLSQSNTLRSAVVALGELRMEKYKVQTAATIELADAAFNDIIERVRLLGASL